MNTDRPYLGMLLMLGFCIAAPLGDSLAKLIGDTVALALLLLSRFAIQAAILLPLALVAGYSLTMPRRVLGLTVLRTVLHIAGIGCMFLSLRYLPLADAVAIAFVMPFIMLLLGHFILGEEVGPRRLGACAVGFVGTMMVVQPSFADVGAPALLPLIVAVVFALFMLVTRAVAKEADPIALQAVSGMLAVPLLLPVAILALVQDWPGAAPADYTLNIWLMIAAIGIMGTGAHLLMTWSLRFAPASSLAPMQYLEIPIATAFGLAIFGDFPDGLALAGILLTTGSGLYIILRERAVARSARITTVPAPTPPA